MPYKDGPNNTKRFYNSSNGRYAKASLEDIVAYEKQFNKRKKSSSEREIERRNILLNKAIKTNDKLLADCYFILEKIKPGCVKIVNEKVFDNVNKKTREFDIVAGKTIIEVKSSIVKHGVKQFTEQKAYADHNNLKFIVFAPNITNARYKNLTQKLGFTVCRNENELRKEIKL